MKFKFESNQQYQVDAINSIIDLFEGQPKTDGNFVDLITHRAGMVIPEDQIALDIQQEIGAVRNNLVLSEGMILENLKRVQERNGLPISNQLIDGLQFDVEMETGTGKTYVYLRTIFELAQKYNFTKFVILVPSVAIREGVNTSIELMRSHFAQLYPSLNFDHFVYSGSNPEEVHSFATATSIQIMVVTIDSIKGDTNHRVFHQQRDKLNGLKPVDFLQAVHPIVIMDEPQNMESVLSKTSIGDLEPTAILRYSATHRKKRNLVYQLDPVAAHELNLVKQIAVSEAVQVGADAAPYIKLIEVKGNPFKAKLELAIRNAKGELTRKQLWVKPDQELARLTGNDAYADWRITEISIEPENIELNHFGRLAVGEQTGGNQDGIYKEMIRETIREHFRKDLLLRSKGIKVLSLFFVDKVANFLGNGVSNDTADGKFAQWFDEIFKEERDKLGQQLRELFPDSPQEYRRSYFSQIKKGVFNDTTGKSKADHDSYELIMKDKARLLSEDEPVRFIFSHSALREGWDNPNVFQICALREMGQETERRQTIGRGLRLPVDSSGARVTDRSVAQLTVIADESYQNFAKFLQKEYEKAGVKIGVVRREEFAKIPVPETENEVIGYGVSELIWEELLRKGFIDKNGHLTDLFTPDKTGFTLDLPSELSWLEPFAIQKIKDLNIERFVKRTEKRKTRKLNKRIYNSELFEEFWNSISRKTTYSVRVDRDELIKNAIANIEEREDIKPLRIRVTKAKLELTRGGAKGVAVSERETGLQGSYDLPDIIGELQEATSLTRKTIIDILIGSGKLGQFLANPNDFIKMVKDCITQALAEIVIDGVQYEQLENGSVYALRELMRDGEEEKQFFIDAMYKVKNQEKTDFDYVVYDSDTERQFAELLDNREDIKLFMKLPPKFKIDTPVGAYNPDWAILKHENGQDRIYMIRETKSTADPNSLRPAERAKIKAARRHFDAIGIQYAKSTPEDWNL